MTNRLAQERSPYLLQHAENPVDWYPWGEEALSRARRENRPILVSIGYSACHWCHVMERESFEDERTAEVMNRNFVNIKVDREERPDVDAIYMEAVQALTGSGGWPLNVFLFPDGRPFYGGTYFPPTPRQGMPSWTQVLESVAEAFRAQREDVLENAGVLTQYLERVQSIQPSRETLTPDLLEAVYYAIEGQFDWKYGGFGRAPKFPQPLALELVLRMARRFDLPRAREFLDLTLCSMAQGGLYDQLGGGFHRYSVDSTWVVPHFEKMLYDNALLARVYLHAYQARGDPFYRQVAEETLEYLLRDMRSPEGGFYSAEDADSEGVEGKYYVWTPEEIAAALGEEDARIVDMRYGVRPGGNFEGKTILTVATSIEEIAEQVKTVPGRGAVQDDDKPCSGAIHCAAAEGDDGGMNRIAEGDDGAIHRATTEDGAAEDSVEPCRGAIHCAGPRDAQDPVEQVRSRLEDARRRLLEARSRRVPPGKDEKVLVSWNALAIRALAEAGRVLGRQDFLDAARAAARFILEKMRPGGRLVRSYLNGPGEVPGFLEDYAFLIEALITLYETEFDAAYLREAQSLADAMIELFWDGDQGAFFDTRAGRDDLIVRPRSFFDNPIPSGNSAATFALLRLQALTGDSAYGERAVVAFRAVGDGLTQAPLGFAYLLSALDFYLSRQLQIAIVGDPVEESTVMMAQAALEPYLPNKVVAVGRRDSAPLLEARDMVDGRPTAYVCEHFACKMPTTDVEALRAQLATASP